jgi:hypothetical protein
MKYCLKGASFSLEEELFLDIYEILMGISLTTLLAAFEDWIKRLIFMAAYEDHYYS